MEVKASNKRLLVRDSDDRIDVRDIVYNGKVMHVLIDGIDRLCRKTISPIMYVNGRKLLKASGFDRLNVYERRLLRKALLKIARVYGMGTYYANDRTYVILDARRLRTMTREEMVEEFTKIILSDGDGA